MTPQPGGLGGRDRPLLKSRDHLDDDSTSNVMGLYIVPRLETDLKRLLRKKTVHTAADDTPYLRRTKNYAFV